jgi:hypothetical protein
MGLSAEFTNSIRSSKIPTASLMYMSVRNILVPLQSINSTARAFHQALDQNVKKIWDLAIDTPAVDAILILMYLNPAILQHEIWDEPNGDATNRTKAESRITTKIEEIHDEEQGRATST